MLADIPFVASYMEKFVTEEVEHWNANWEAHGDGCEKNKILFYQIMQAYADVLPSGTVIPSKRTKDGQEKVTASHALLGVTCASSREPINGTEDAAAHDTQISGRPLQAHVR